MATFDNKTALKNARQRNYLARDFDGFRSVILEYARQYYPDRIQDFSESSLGGLLLDMAAYVGDNMSFYLDHLYNELNSDTAVENASIERIVRNAGIPIVGASPALVYIDFYVEVPVLSDQSLTPDPTLLPTIRAGSTFKSDNGTQFQLIENVDFWKLDEDGDAIVSADDVVTGRRVAGSVISKILRKKGLCTSGAFTTETFTIGNFLPFRRLTLAFPNVTRITSVTDANGNEYYEVGNLTHDVVYKNVLNTTEKDEIVKDALKVVPAPYRYTSTTDLTSRTTTLTFGGGNADTLEDDVIPDPSEFAIPLPYSQTFSRVAINPQKMLETTTLGVAAANTTLSISYRYGGGLSHNVPAGSIRTATFLDVVFPENPSIALQLQVKNSIEVVNPKDASGGEDPPSADELLELVPTVKNSQERIVTKEDLLARVYSMPSNFGRVFRAAVSKNPNNPLASQLFIISRNPEQQLVPAPDALKINLKRFLNSYRMVSDSLDIQDAAIINIEINFSVVVDPSLNKLSIIQSIIRDLQNEYRITRMQINQPIIISDITSIIFARQGIISVDRVEVNNLFGKLKGLEYSPIHFDIPRHTKNQIIYPPTGAIFEIRYPDINITGKAVSNV